MAIDDRHLSAGTLLTARYKGQTYTAIVVEQEGALRYQLADGRTFKSPSSAGKAVLEGKACNGWAFWRVTTASDLAAAETEQPPSKRGRKPKKTEEAEATPAAEPTLTDETPQEQETLATA